MAKYRLTPRAQRDMRDIWRNIALDNEKAADKLLNRLFDKFELAAGHPEMGPVRPELSETARILIEGRYIAIYEPAPYGILVIAVVHGMRDPATWL
ncbi:type II toxin-antitoxin system RelE/ParE family toxin [Rhizobiaceae sp. 2RAB30]